MTFPTELNTRPHSSEDVNGNIDDLGPVKPLGTASCSRSYVFLLFSRDYHSGLLSETSTKRFFRAVVIEKRQNKGHGSNAGHSSGVAGVDARRATPPDPRLARWGLAGCRQLDPSHPAL